MSKDNKQIQKYADLKRRPIKFNKGDDMLLKLTMQIWKKIIGKTRHQGLVQRYDGSFEVME